MDYKSTIQLPKTAFPMKADLARREPQQLAAWEQMGLYAKTMEARKGAPAFVLHDGPPYSNGRIHIGHALNKILKDIVIKSKILEGRFTPFVPGWDCHGLPIEHQVMKEAGPQARSLDKGEIRRRCRAYAAKFMAIQREEFQRLGCLGDWAHPYLTMEPGYEAAIIRELGKCAAAGGVYKAKKPVLWCWQDETALAEAEVEYEDDTSPSIYVKFPVKNPKGRDGLAGTFVVIWTTTPWTLVANQAITLHPMFQYRRVQTPAGELIIAQNLVAPCMKAFGYADHDYKILDGSWTGQELEGVICRHPWIDRDVPLIVGEHVTLDQGTGCVHTAPGHGQEDYEVGLKYGLPVYAPVDHQGNFTPEAGPFAGQHVFKANPAIIALLKERNMLLKEESLAHSYPHCWRCKSPVIFRATDQWFISMMKNHLRQRALKEIDQTTWIPAWGRDRIHGMVQNRPDWCISRQRAWGVPIVAFRCRRCQRVHSDQALIEHVAGLVEQSPEGSDLWFTKEAEALLPPGYACCNERQFDKEMDILDVWFESGVSHAAVLKRRPELSAAGGWPADLYLEGSDQHRGWFHSSLLAALQTDGRAPYQAVLTHGFVVDGEGRKMSKSAGNVVAPQEVIERHGAEILRLWVAAADYREDVRISPQILEQLVETYRKIRNTCRYLLGNLADFDPAADRVTPDQMDEIDRWALHRLQEVMARVGDAYRQYEFHLVLHTLNHFCAAELSALYFDILKDRLYCDGRRSRSRRAAQTVLYDLLQAIIRLMAPVLSFTADEVWQAMPDAWRPQNGRESALLARFSDVALLEPDPSWADKWGPLMAIREEVAKALEAARQSKTIGGSLDAAVELTVDQPTLARLQSHEAMLPSFFIVSQVVLRPSLDGTRAVRVAKAPGRKCVRCWRYDPAVGAAADHPELCQRCAAVVRDLA
ncbi:MAG: isoleucine--tRNA ligase [Nitrospirota bacterium]